MRRNIIIFMTMALVLAACGSGDAGSPGIGDPDTPDTTSGPLEAPDEVRPLLTVLEEGGFVPVEWNLRRIPRYVLMSDGTLYGPGPVPAIFPGPALPAVQAVEVDDATMAEIAALIETSELDTVDEERNDAAAARVADLPDTVFVYVDDAGVEHRFTVYALGIDDVDFGDARIAHLEELVQVLDEAMAAGSADQYRPDSIDVYVAAQGNGFDEQYANTQDWPLDVPFDELEGDTVGYRCIHLDGSEATAVLDRLGTANEATTFVDEAGTEHTVLVRLVLPGQQSNC